MENFGNETIKKNENSKNGIRGNIVEYLHADAMKSESFEDVSSALDGVLELEDFRKQTQKFPFNSFFHVFEDSTNINRSDLSQEEKSERVRALVDEVEGKISRFSPRVTDLYGAILSDIRGEEYSPKFEMTGEKMAEMKESGDLETLLSGEASWKLKLNRIETRIAGYLQGARALDKREGNEMADDEREARAEKLKNAPTNPPERRNESKPSMDEMNRLKSGERAPAIWSINPAYGGYFREQAFSSWDSRRNVWREEKYEYQNARFVPSCEKEDRQKGFMNITMKAMVFAGKWTTLPVPYTHGLYVVKSGNSHCEFQEDQNGDVVIFVHGNNGEMVDVEAVLAPISDKTYGPTDPKKILIPNMPANFSEETLTAIAKKMEGKRGNVARATALASYTRQHLTYSNESKYNEIYDTDSRGYFSAIDTYGKADCDVANTYFSALCARENIPVRQVVGHMVKGRDISNSSSITSGTGHAWSEVWNEKENKWVRMDATPAGDPNLEEEQEEQEKQKGSAPIPGDYGENEAIRPTDEQLEALRKKLEEQKVELSYTREERQLAEGANIELSEARKIVKEINEAENTRLPNGERITDVLSRLFNAIVESRKTTTADYTGPVRRAEGGERIENIVRHRLGVIAGQSDPISREKPTEETAEEQSIGGFDYYMIGDKSGSMSNSSDGETLWKMQRRAEYLIFSALHRFEREIKRAGIPAKDALAVRSQGISFRGSDDDDIDLDKPLSSDFSAMDKVKMWNSLTNQGVGNGDTTALTYIRDQILKEKENIEKTRKKDNRLRLITACSDGAPDSTSNVRALAKELGAMHATVVGIGLTDTAATVPITFDTAYSRGDIARDLNDLPIIVGKHLVLEAIKLFPERAKKDAEKLVKNILLKFEKK